MRYRPRQVMRYMSPRAIGAPSTLRAGVPVTFPLPSQKRTRSLRGSWYIHEDQRLRGSWHVHEADSGLPGPRAPPALQEDLGLCQVGNSCGDEDGGAPQRRGAAPHEDYEAHAPRDWRAAHSALGCGDYFRLWRLLASHTKIIRLMACARRLRSSNPWPCWAPCAAHSAGGFRIL